MAIAILSAGVFLRVFVIDSYIVRGNSMEPTINEGDYVFVNKLSYAFSKEPQRGDIVVAHFRENNSPSVIKRVIGLPGERVEIRPDKITIKKDRYDEGEVVKEEYLLFESFTLNGDEVITLDPKEYFLMGDNRLASIDSREFGPVDHWDLSGKVIFKISTKKLGITRY